MPWRCATSCAIAPYTAAIAALRQCIGLSDRIPTYSRPPGPGRDGEREPDGLAADNTAGPPVFGELADQIPPSAVLVEQARRAQDRHPVVVVARLTQQHVG